MTEQLFREDSYLRECDAVVVAIDDDAIVLDRTVFYPIGGGQAADTGTINWEGGSTTVIDTRYGDGGAIRHIVKENAARPQAGDQVRASIDWDRRYRHMRMHTALHLLGSILKYGVTGGNISAEKSRLDFDMEDTIDKEEVATALKKLVEENHSISCRWI
ncbi:MAG: alanyl-tRNA editing protein, partial [Woeseiaceae bacterium]